MEDTIQLKVNRWDLLGKYENRTSCPIARAAKRHFKTNEISVLFGVANYATGDYYAMDSSTDFLAASRARSIIGIIRGGFTVTLTKRQ